MAIAVLAACLSWGAATEAHARANARPTLEVVRTEVLVPERGRLAGRAVVAVTTRHREHRRARRPLHGRGAIHHVRLSVRIADRRGGRLLSRVRTTDRLAPALRGDEYVHELRLTLGRAASRRVLRATGRGPEALTGGAIRGRAAGWDGASVLLQVSATRVRTPAAEEPAAEDPSTEVPVADEPATPVRTPAAEEPATEDPSTEEPVADEPAATQQVVADDRATAIVPVQSVQTLDEPVEHQFRMRTLGDSVTAGFGFFADGSAMSVFDLISCIPPAQPNDRCSSNATAGSGPGYDGPLGWGPDFGLSNDISWAAQFANSIGLDGAAEAQDDPVSEVFQNRAVTGSTPAQWDEGGYLNDVLQEIVADDPDLIATTIGANPLLDEFLFGSGLRDCLLIWSDSGFEACVDRSLEQVGLHQHLVSVADQLLEAPSATVAFFQYHQAIPGSSLFSVERGRQLGAIINAAIAEAIADARNALPPGERGRLVLVTPPLFAVGVAPGEAVCASSELTVPVDGPSAQATITQDELAVTRYFSGFCPGEPWIISSDTGIHPNQAGYAQFAAALSAAVL